MKATPYSALVLSGLLLLAAPAPTQTGTLDQVSPFSSAASSCGASGANFNGSTNWLVWQCEVMAGMGGVLEGFELELLGPEGAHIDARVRLGAGWNTGPVLWSGSYDKLTTFTEIAWFDASSANISLNTGDLYVIELQGDDTGTNVTGTYNPPPNRPCYGRDLFLNGPGCYADCGWRIGFHTYMLAGGGGPSLAVSNLISGQTATLTVNNATPSGLVGFAYSLTGPGPSSASAGPCGLITVDLSAPVTVVGTTLADGAGTANLSAPVPSGTTGVSVWIQALDVASCTLTNGLAEVIG